MRGRCHFIPQTKGARRLRVKPMARERSHYREMAELPPEDDEAVTWLASAVRALQAPLGASATTFQNETASLRNQTRSLSYHDVITIPFHQANQSVQGEAPSTQLQRPCTRDDFQLRLTTESSATAPQHLVQPQGSTTALPMFDIAVLTYRLSRCSISAAPRT